VTFAVTAPSSAKLPPEKASMATVPQHTIAKLDNLRMYPSRSKFLIICTSCRSTLLRPLAGQANQEFFFNRIKAKPNKNAKIPTYIIITSLVVVSGSSILAPRSMMI
jgi:hypothetical protein